MIFSLCSAEFFAEYRKGIQHVINFLQNCVKIKNTF
jgi:hypothetical protein